MKKFFVSTSFIIIFIISIVYQRIASANISPVATNLSAPPADVKIIPVGTSPVPTPVLTLTPTPVQTLVPTPTLTPTPTPVPTPTPIVSQGKYRNGTYTGAAADAAYGTVQVAAVIVSGKLSNINFLNYPSDRQHSAQVSSYALPILRQEAIAVQSASVDTISGASYTSAAFIESLNSALSQAM